MANANYYNNSFDFIRLAAAFGVLISHSYPLAGLSEITYAKNISVGTLCVYIFFSISGYLIQQSWDRSKSVIAFIINRILRIYPGLFICLLLSTILLFFISNYSFLEYFRNIKTYQYVLTNLIPILMPWQDSLPGVFESTIFPIAVNGSLWSIRYEIVMYFVLLSLILITKNRLSFLIILILLTLFTWSYAFVIGLKDPGQVIWRVQFFNLDSTFLFRLAPFFLVGAALAKLPIIIFQKYIFLLILITLVIFNNSDLNMPILWIGLPYCIIFLAIHLPNFFKNWAKHGDFSFGIYLYAFPIQQVVSNSSYFKDSHNLLILTSSFIVFLFAYLSWHLVEAPSLKMKRPLIKYFRDLYV